MDGGVLGVRLVCLRMSLFHGLIFMVFGRVFYRPLSQNAGLRIVWLGQCLSSTYKVLIVAVCLQVVRFCWEFMVLGLGFRVVVFGIFWGVCLLSFLSRRVEGLLWRELNPCKSDLLHAPLSEN